jgi:hypothetical protein
MPDEATFRIVLEDKGPPAQPSAPAGGPPSPNQPAPTGKPAGGGNQPAAPAGGPNFPATVLGPDGKSYSFEAYQSATKKIQGQRHANESKSAYDAFYGPPPLPKKAAGGATEEPKAAGLIEQLLSHLGGGKIASALGFGGGSKPGAVTPSPAGGVAKAGASGGTATAAGGAEAAGAAGALGGIAAAAGPVALVALAANQAASSLRNMKGMVDALSSSAEGLAKNDLAQVQAGLDEFGEKVIGSVPILGDLANAQIGLIKSIISIPDKLSNAFIQQAHAISPYSGAIAGSEAQAEIRSIRADMREANELGPDMARLIDAQSRFDNSMRELILPIKKFLVEVLAERLEMIAKLIEIGVNLPDILKTIMSDLGQALILSAQLEFTKARETIAKIPEDIDKILKKDDDDLKDFTDSFFGDMRGALGGDGAMGAPIPFFRG